MVTFVTFNIGNARFVFAFPFEFTSRKAKSSAAYVDHLLFHSEVAKLQKIVLNFTISVSVWFTITADTQHWIRVERSSRPKANVSVLPISPLRTHNS